MDRGRKKGRKGKECELCSATARMYCESDEAMLCWECDALVHGANFLVARHTRALLCRTCQSPTPWRASGSRLGPSVSLCHRCSPPSQSPADDLRLGGERGGRSDSESEDDDGDGENGEEDEGDSEMEDSAAATAEEEEEGENQVVPWSPPPPPPTSLSSSEEESSSRAEMGAGSCGGSGSSLKRMRDNADLASHPQDDLPSSSLQLSLFPSAQPPPPPLPLFSGRTDTDDDDDDDDDDDGETTSVGGGRSNRAGFHLPNDRRRRLAQPTSSTRRSQPTTAGEPCGSSRATISTIDFVQAT